VIVGIVDSHPDIYHVDFRNNDSSGGDNLGSTRLLFYWNQFLSASGTESAPPTAPALPGFTPASGTSYGVEYSQANINAELNAFSPAGSASPNPAYQLVRHPYSSVPIDAHGTHVMGCAAGNGRSGNVGAAPGADLIYVELAGTNGYIHADQTTLADAFAYIFARATALGQPCVINRSGSDNMGPHDGSTLGEQFLDNLLLVSGRAITFAAGNTDNQNSHTSGTVTQGNTTTLNLNYFTADANFDGINDLPRRNDQIEIWYDGHDAFGCTLTLPGGTSIGPIAPGNTSAVTNLPNGNTVQIVHGQNDPRNGDNVITIFIGNVSGTNTIPLGNWSIQLSGTTVINGNFAAWVERNNRRLRSWGTPVAGSMTIATPATSLRSIAVGAHDVTAGTPNTTAFTSAGPTRDGRIKPDISANGLSVTAARSTDRNSATPGSNTSVKSGTSMAAPIVAGACACLFECRGAGLNWFDLKQILWNTAGSPAAGIPSNKFGFGFLQMTSACTTPDPDVDAWLRDDVPDTGVEPYVGGISWRSPDI
ncbi:MAG: S8 family serine peptidase, partial [Bacteroidota bacterium]